MNNLKEQLKIYINNNFIQEEKNKHGLFRKLRVFNEECSSFDLEDNYLSEELIIEKNNSNIHEFINQHEEYNDFQTMLFNLIDARELKDSDVYNKVHIDRRLFSKIRSDKNYHPSKETVILLAIALELSEEELETLLDSASYSLPKNNNFDLIIRFCFINKIFKLTDINELLNEYNCKLFSY